MKMLNLTKLRCLTTVLSLLLFACSPILIPEARSQDAMKIAAVVNDDVITELDLITRLQMAIVSANLENTPETRDRLIPQILRTLIDERLKRQEAEREEIVVEQADIDRRIERIAERNGMSLSDFQTILISNGILDALSDQIRAELGWARLVQRKLRPQITVTEEEIDDELSRIQAAEGQTEYRLSQIFLAVDAPDQESSVRESAMRLLQQLQAGADFASLAREFSQDEGAFKGGDWGWMRIDQMEPEVAKGVAAVPMGELIGPIRGTGGFYIALVRETRTSSAGVAAEGIVNVKQILWGLASNAAESEVDKATSQARTMSSKIQSCDDVSTFAAEASPGVYRELGNVPVGDLPPEVQQVALNQPVGLPSDPVRTSQGVGIYLICDRQVGDEETLSRTAIADRLGRQRLETLARGYLSDLRRSAVIELRP